MLIVQVKCLIMIIIFWNKKLEKISVNEWKAKERKIVEVAKALEKGACEIESGWFRMRRFQN